MIHNLLILFILVFMVSSHERPIQFFRNLYHSGTNFYNVYYYQKRKKKTISLSIIDNASLKSAVEFSLNYQQQKVGISANYFFPFICFVIFVLVTHKFAGKCYLIF